MPGVGTNATPGMPSIEETNETPGSAKAETQQGQAKSRDFIATFRTQAIALTPAAAATVATGSAR
jgi:hypothetical protein